MKTEAMGRQARAFAMFDKGDSVNAVADAVYKKYWAAAKKAKTAWDASRGTAASEPAAEAADADSQIWGVEIQVPVGRTGEIFRAFSEQEQIDAI